jgi:hypothetical protein
MTQQTKHSETPMVALRTPATVMRLDRMGAAHPMRLSFLRILLRRAQRENWQFTRSKWNVDDKGVGHAVYQARGPERTYSLIAFAHDLPDEDRTDRVIATAWDATFTLFDGIPSEDDIHRLSQNVPHQEAGRISEKEICLSRANRSVRLFNYVVGKLAKGEQPDAEKLFDVGYLMRTTAVYGSGKFGAVDYSAIQHREELQAPFQAEMLTVWLIRWFAIDIVNHMAKCAGAERAAELDPLLARRLGVGNSTGLGMAPFLVRHPDLVNAWVTTRETALARVRSLSACDQETKTGFLTALAEAIENAQLWNTSHPLQVTRLVELRNDLSLLNACTHTFDWDTKMPWDRLWIWGEQHLSNEGQEALLSLLLEPHGNIIDDLASNLSSPSEEDTKIDGAMTVSELKKILNEHFLWAVSTNFQDKDENALFWYVSEEKLEPRIGRVGIDEGHELEQPLGIARLISNLSYDVESWNNLDPIAAFLMRHPEHRLAVKRVQQAPLNSYGEIQDNLVGKDTLPIDMMRCKLAFFGASRFDPRSDKWVRISLFQDMPFPYQLVQE